jgi:hypothetical protein
MKLYKFRPLGKCTDLSRIKSIISKGFYCSDFLRFNDVNEGVFTINKHNMNITLSEKQQYKICCFSRENALNSQLMWGHYANAGMGVAIEVDVTNCENIEPVLYSDEDKNLNTIKQILIRKSKEWSYENECRYLTNEKLENDKIKLPITKIYFGTPYENLGNYTEIKDKHTGLIKYYGLKEELKEFCKRKSIPCEDWVF